MELGGTWSLLGAAALVLGGIALLSYIRRRPASERDALDRVGAIMAMLVLVGGSVLGILSGLEAAGVNIAPQRGVVGTQAPSLTMRSVEGGEVVPLSAYEGEVVVLNLWATWCAPCLEELPDLNRLQRTYGEEGVQVVMVSDEAPATLERFARQRTMEADNLYLPDETEWPPPYDRVNAARPTTFVIDRSGTIQETWPGIADYGQLENAVRPHL